MTNFPDFASHGYQVKKELGHNKAGGRVTYLAIRIPPNPSLSEGELKRVPVVIKQFQFASTGADWSAYKAVEREIQVLQQLDYPGIPKYLDSFETDSGFCMVQEYKNAPSLAVPRSFDPDRIKQLAISILEILQYLQTLAVPVIHRDIKPENILVSESDKGRLNVYLVDFGFAKLGAGEVAMSSMVKGTLGFMPPEQLFNRQLTAASDLYGVGATLICLLTGTKSHAIGDLVDEDYRINFKHLVPKLSLRWIDWLEKMVKPNPGDRYPDAKSALEALKPIYVIRTPEIQIHPPSLEFTASSAGEKLIQTITLKNPVPQTVLSGSWEVAPHISDPPHTPESHSWIFIEPSLFQKNRVECKITVDTSHLRAGQIYDREVLLHTNAVPATTAISLQVQTAPIPIAIKKLPYGFLGMLFLTSGAAGMVAVQSAITLVAVAIAGFVTWSGIWKLAGARSKVVKALITSLTTAVIAGGVGFGVGVVAGATVIGAWAVAGTWTAIATGAASIFAASGVKKEFGTRLATTLSLLTAVSGICLGIGVKLGLWSPLLLAAIAATGLPVLALILLLPLQQARRLSQYRRSEEHLIKP